MNKLKKRILEISYKHNLSHIGSCLTCVDCIEKIYSLKKSQDVFVLDNGHAGLAQYVVIEKYLHHNAEQLFTKMGVHPEKNEDYDIAISSGSLGLAGSIALGMALADPLRNIYVITSDGAMMEGIWYETLRNAAKLSVTNYKLVINCNGYGALSQISSAEITAQLRGCGWGIFETDKVSDLEEVFKIDSDVPIAVVMHTNTDEFPFLKGLDAHYHVMTKEEYDSVI